MPFGLRHIDFVLILLGVATVASVVEALDHSGWKGATIVTGLLTVTWLFYSVAYANRFLLLLWGFAIVAGFAELWTDCVTVDLNILVYADGGPFIACSPLYMPFGWAIELAELTFIARYLLHHVGLSMPLVVVLTGLLSALQLPLAEYLARSAGLWHYQNVPMAFGTVPYLIISSELLVGLALPLIATALHRAHVEGYGLARAAALAIAMGLALGLWIRIAAWISLKLFS